MFLDMEDIGRFGMYGTSVVLCLVIFVRVRSIMRDSVPSYHAVWVVC